MCDATTSVQTGHLVTIARFLASASTAPRAITKTAPARVQPVLLGPRAMKPVQRISTVLIAFSIARARTAAHATPSRASVRVRQGSPATIAIFVVPAERTVSTAAKYVFARTALRAITSTGRALAFPVTWGSSARRDVLREITV